MTGACVAATGACRYNPLPPGTQCGTGAASRCCFGECIDTETCVMDHLEAMRSLRYLPAIK